MAYNLYSWFLAKPCPVHAFGWSYHGSFPKQLLCTLCNWRHASQISSVQITEERICQQRAGQLCFLRASGELCYGNRPFLLQPECSDAQHKKACSPQRCIQEGYTTNAFTFSDTAQVNGREWDHPRCHANQHTRAPTVYGSLVQYYMWMTRKRKHW